GHTRDDPGSIQESSLPGSLSNSCNRERDGRPLVDTVERQPNGERGAERRVAGRGDVPAVGLHDLAHDREAEAAAVLAPRARPVDLKEALEHSWQILWRNIRTGVVDRHEGFGGVLLSFQP